MPAVGNARVEAVTSEVVHLVDVDRAGEQRVQDAAGRIGGRARDEGCDAGRGEAPGPVQHRGRLAAGEDALHERFVPRKPGQPDVLDGMTEGPVADVVHEGRHQECRRVVLVDDGYEPGVVFQPGEKLDRPSIDAQGMFQP